MDPIPCSCRMVTFGIQKGRAVNKPCVCFAPSTSSINVHHLSCLRFTVSPAFSSNQIKRMNTLAIEKCESWIQRRLKASNGGVVRFDVAVEMIDIVLSAFCETAFDYKMPKWERDYLGEELECALVCYFARKFSITLELHWLTVPFLRFRLSLPARDATFSEAN